MAISMLMACNNEKDEMGTEPENITDGVWQIVSKSENSKDSSYPITVKGDFDNDGTEETLKRNDFYIFEDGWAFRAYSYTVLNDEGTDVTTLQSRSGQLFAAASPYTLNEDQISIFLKNYTITQSVTELEFNSDKHQLMFKKIKTIDKSQINNAPLEPENNGNMAAKTWRIKQETGFEAKPNIYYPLEKVDDFDEDGTNETIKRDDFYVFDIPRCYTAYVSTILDDQGTDQLCLQENNGVLQIKHINYFIFNSIRDSIYFNGNGYTYFNDGESITLQRGNYKATFEVASDIQADRIKAMYNNDDTW